MSDRDSVARELGDLLRVLSHPERILIVQLLARRGEHRVGSIARFLGAPEARTSQHLACLRGQRLVLERAEGRERRYRLAQPELANWIDAGVEFVAGRVGEVSAAQVEAVRQAWRDATAP